MNIPEEVYRGILKKEDSKSLHPSGCTSQSCIRQEMYRVKGYQVSNPPPPGQVWRLKKYTLFEDYIAPILVGGHERTERQVPVKWRRWSGRMDIIVPEDGLYVPVEIKSVSPWALRRTDMPYQHHVDQLLVYFYLMRKVDFDLADYGVLVYIERWDERRMYPEEQLPEMNPTLYEKGIVSNPEPGVPAMIQFEIAPAREDLDYIGGLMWEMETWLDAKELPPRPYGDPTEHPWNCTSYNKKTDTYEARCPYLNICWPGPF